LPSKKLPSPTPPNYPFQLVGTTSSPQTVTLTNTGSVALSIASIKVSGPFHARNTCGSSVASGGSCTITTVFKPTTTGSASGTVTIIDSASSKPQVIYLTGIGTEVSLNPLKLEFAAQKVGTTSAPQTVQVTNTAAQCCTSSTFLPAAKTAKISPTATTADRILPAERVAR
jgi:hypothetical protein